MNNDRYARMIQYESSLDHLYASIDPLNPYDSSYQKTLSEAKVAGFRVLRNGQGIHKLEDKYPGGKMDDILNIFGDAFRAHEF